MKKSILWLCAVAITLASWTQVQAQKSFQGTVKYDIKISGDDPQIAMLSALDMSMEMAFLKSKARISMLMGALGSTINITDNKTKEGLTLMNMMGSQQAARMDKEDMEEGKEDMPKDIEVVRTGETKEIAGYKCEKVIVNADGREMSIYITDKIKLTKSPQMLSMFGDIDGMPLSFEIIMDPSTNSKMTMTATDVDRNKPDKALFSLDIPEGYTEVDSKELGQGMGF